MGKVSTNLLYKAQEQAWTNEGFTEEQAIEWIDAGFSLLTAKFWSKFNFTPAEAEQWRRAFERVNEIITPDIARMYANAGVSYDEAATVIRVEQRIRDYTRFLLKKSLGLDD